MEFLKVLGDEIYAQLEAAIEAYNGNEANKEKPIKIGNLASGEYIGKGKYDAEVAASKGKDTEIENFKKAIEDLKKSNKGNEDIQTRISQLETENAKLSAENDEIKKDFALRLALTTEKVSDVDYVSYKLIAKLKEEGKNLELDDNGNIKGWADMLSGLKTQFPTQFETAGKKTIIPNKLPEGDPNGGAISKEAFLKMGVDERSKFKAENEQLYNTYTGKV